MTRLDADNLYLVLEEMLYIATRNFDTSARREDNRKDFIDIICKITAKQSSGGKERG